MSFATARSNLDSLQSQSFDYIICGGGTAGCVIASQLASRLPEVQILLVEAGRDSGTSPDVLVPGKFVQQLSTDKDGLWEMPTIPQNELNGRELVFLRGKQIGGSSAINYMALARGPAADYDEWAERVGDNSWKWDNILPKMKEESCLESFRPNPPPGFEMYGKTKDSNHGTMGPISIGFGDVMVPGVQTFISACTESGIPLCLDNNSGDPIGVGLAQCNVGNGERSYAATAYLDPKTRKSLKNLTIITSTSVNRVLFDGVTANGVELYNYITSQKVQVRCTSEVIICGGTFGSPQLLLLSGIGPQGSLGELKIPTISHLAGVGQNMLDHSILTIEFLVDSDVPAHNQIFEDATLLAEAEKFYAENKIGPLAVFGASGGVAFPKIPRIYESEEFRELDQRTQKFMTCETRPSTEIWLGSGPSTYIPEEPATERYMNFELLLQNNLSKGSVELNSTNPRDLPKIDPNFLSHAFDRRIAIESIREAIRIAQSSVYKGIIRKMVHGPGTNSDISNVDTSDEAILKFVREYLGQGYHSMATCKMGLKNDPLAVVDNSFKVFGVQGLRVADLSVCPVLTNNHTQINVYMIAEKCVETIVRARRRGGELRL